MPFQHLDSASLRRVRAVRAASAAPKIVLLSALLGVTLCAASVSRAEEALTPVHLRAAGKEVICKTGPLSDGRETYISSEALAAVQLEGRPNRKGDALLITNPRTGKSGEIALAQVKGQTMLALSDLARFLNAVIDRPHVGGEGKPENARLGDTVYLLARVTDVRFDGDAV